MMNREKIGWTLGVLALSCCLSACGGTPSPGQPQTQAESGVSVSPGALSVNPNPWNLNAPEEYLFCTVDTLDQDVSARAAYTQKGISTIDTFVQTDSYYKQTTFRMHLVFKYQNALGPGVYKDEITLSVCKDLPSRDCQHPLPGSPWIVPVTYTVSGSGNRVTPGELKVTYLTGDPPPAAALTFSGTGGWSASTDFPWIQLGARQGQAPSALTVTFDTSAMGPGDHYGTIVLTDGDLGTFGIVPVTLSIT